MGVFAEGRTGYGKRDWREVPLTTPLSGSWLPPGTCPAVACHRANAPPWTLSPGKCPAKDLGCVELLVWRGVRVGKALLRAGGPHRGGRCLAEFNSAGRSPATRMGREAPGDLRHRVGAQQWAMWSVSLVGWRAFKARAVPHTERGNGGQCDPPGQGRSSVPRRTGDKSVTRRCEPVESGPPAVSGPSEESVVTESGERSREKERHSVRIYTIEIVRVTPSSG
ncbi:hypothetical protein ACJJTC_002071 [Scirpophaga incertulas]